MSGIGDPDRLYKLMPAVYRERDEQEAFPLRDLLRLVTEQSDILYSDIQLLWDNFFIETCDRWAIPYIGDLISNRLLNDAQNLKDPDTARELFLDLARSDLRPTNAIRSRAVVGQTIYNRRLNFFFQAEDGIRDGTVTGIQTCALPISATSDRNCAIAACRVDGASAGAVSAA